MGQAAWKRRRRPADRCAICVIPLISTKTIRPTIRESGSCRRIFRYRNLTRRLRSRDDVGCMPERFGNRGTAGTSASDERSEGRAETARTCVKRYGMRHTFFSQYLVNAFVTDVYVAFSGRMPHHLLFGYYHKSNPILWPVCISNILLCTFHNLLFVFFTNTIIWFYFITINR